ncbi:DUF3280 domain-containing protein [Roseibium algae]|uniref:DUF3280 domain-containing protein n=1 Tax=Roseibium algae TaxID=3123038 RepID=A0ABU8TN69_9HYPH
MTVFLLLFLSVSAGAEVLEPDSKVAFLGLVFMDTSTEGAYNGERSDETERLALLEGIIEQRFRDEGIPLMDLSPIAEKLENTANVANCYGCEVRMAEALGADFVMVGMVQKVSNLIISMNLSLRDVGTGQVMLARSVEVRSNTDQSWSRGMRYILKTAFFRKNED